MASLSAQTASASVATSSDSVQQIYGWDRALGRFLINAGLVQTLAGLKNDMIVMNRDWELTNMPYALEKFKSDLQNLGENSSFSNESDDDKRLAYVSVSEPHVAASPRQMLRQISEFIAKNRARNNISNRNEFLRKRQNADAIVPLDSLTSMDVDIPSCARIDAIPVNRDIQMKYDVAKNDGGPLMRTIKVEQGDEGSQALKDQSKSFVDSIGERTPTLQLHPGLSERFSNLETHLSVRYVPGPPASLLDRIKFLEDHIIKLERDYPPWAALHFNQPNRGWPPPPRATPLIIPTHLASITDTSPTDAGIESSPTVSTPSNTVGVTAGISRGKARPKKSSSLHRAVMQKLEVKRALAGQD